MPIIKTKTKVIMDSGKEYVIDEHPEDLLRRIYDENKSVIKIGFIHGPGFSLATQHVSSIEDIEQEQGLPYMGMVDGIKQKK